MKDFVYIVRAKRSAIARYGGSYLNIPVTDLAATVINGVLLAFPQLGKNVDEVIMGNVLSAGVGQNPARIASIKSGIPNIVPAFTLNIVCGSGLKSVLLGVNAILQGDARMIVAGGMENMSRAPHYVDNYRFGVKFGDQILRDGMIYDGLFCSLIGEHMGITAENIAKKYKISREQQDAYAYESHQKAVNAIDNKKFAEEIVPIEIKNKKGTLLIQEDEQPRRDTTLEALTKLKPAFKKDGLVTAGNSSSLNDGASAILLASKAFVKKQQLKPEAKILSYAYVGLDPMFMGLGSYYAAVECVKKAGMKLSEIDLWEINEAFASQSIAVIQLLGVNPKVVNVNGGAIALGHPIGASGARITTSLIYELKRRKKRYGVASLCIGGGQGIAALIEVL